MSWVYVLEFTFIALTFTGAFWAGWTDIESEGNFTNLVTGEALEENVDLSELWWPGEPNGGVLESCATIWPSRGAWGDFMCFGMEMAFCNIQPRPRLIMRGDCCIEHLSCILLRKKGNSLKELRLLKNQVISRNILCL